MCDTAVPHLSGIRSADIGPPRQRGRIRRGCNTNAAQSGQNAARTGPATLSRCLTAASPFTKIRN